MLSATSYIHRKSIAPGAILNFLVFVLIPVPIYKDKKRQLDDHF